MKMADKLKKSNQRHQQNVDESDQKRPKPEECKNSVDTVETKNITNIYYDCLERIFDFLDLESLLMVAQTCKRLQIAAAAKFGDEFGKKRIWLCPRRPQPAVIVHKEDVHVFGLKLCLAFLRCFGAKISDIFVYFYKEDSKEGYLAQYVNQYCSDTLIKIAIENKLPFSNQIIQKPFKNVEKVEIRSCDLRNQLTNFVNWFPNLRHFDLFKCLFDKTAPMNVSFPHLEHLELDIHPYKFGIEDAANLLQANPQLKSLKIWWYSELALSTILDTITANSSITKLEAVGFDLFPSSVNVNTDELNRFAIEHPLVEEVNLSWYRLTAVDAINFIRQMKSLKGAEFQVKNRPECDRLTQEFNNEWKTEVSTYDDIFYIKLNR